MRTCPNCAATDLPDKAKVCGHCGTRVEAANDTGTARTDEADSESSPQAGAVTYGAAAPGAQEPKRRGKASLIVGGLLIAGGVAAAVLLLVLLPGNSDDRAAATTVTTAPAVTTAGVSSTVAAATTTTPKTATPSDAEQIAGVISDLSDLVDDGSYIEALATGTALIDQLASTSFYSEISDDRAATHNLIGRSHSGLGDHQSAIDSFRDAMRIAGPGGGASGYATLLYSTFASNLGEELLATLPDELEVVANQEVGLWPEGIAVTDDYVWVAMSGDRAVWRLDHETLERNRTVSVGRLPVNIVTDGSGTVWTLAETSKQLWSIEEATGSARVVWTYSDCVDDLAFHDGYLYTMWLGQCAVRDPGLIRIDPATGEDTIFQWGNVSIGQPFDFHVVDTDVVSTPALVISDARDGNLAMFSPTFDYFGDDWRFEASSFVRYVTSDDQFIYVDVADTAGGGRAVASMIYRIGKDSDGGFWSTEPELLGTVPDAVVRLATYGDYVLAVGDSGMVHILPRESPGVWASLDTGLGPFQSIKDAVVDGDRLIISYQDAEGVGYVATIVLGPGAGQ